MHELEWIRGALHDRRLFVVAENTGLHVNTIAAIRDGKNANPKLETLGRLADYLRGDMDDGGNIGAGPHCGTGDMGDTGGAQ